MPVAQQDETHREKNELFAFPVDVCVARPVGKAEIQKEPAALESLLKEWSKLRTAKVWDESKVREWADVAAEARKKDAKAHVGRIFEICVEKGAELPKGNPGRSTRAGLSFKATMCTTKTGRRPCFSKWPRALLRWLLPSRLTHMAS